MQEAGLKWGERLFYRFKFLRHGFDIFVRVRHVHARINNVRLPPAGDFFANELEHLRQLVRSPHKRLDAAAAGRQFINHRDI